MLVVSDIPIPTAIPLLHIRIPTFILFLTPITTSTPFVERSQVPPDAGLRHSSFYLPTPIIIDILIPTPIPPKHLHIPTSVLIHIPTPIPVFRAVSSPPRCWWSQTWSTSCCRCQKVSTTNNNQRTTTSLLLSYYITNHTTLPL